MHVNPGVAASVIGVSKILDGLSDLVAGRVINKTHHKLGKARILAFAYDSGYDRLLVFDVSYACESYGICTDFVHVCYIYLVSTVCYTLTSLHSPL